MNNIKKTSLLLSVICIALFAVQSPAYSRKDVYANDERPEAAGGVIDLRSWDFQKNGSVPLKGDWKFRWNEDNPAFSKESIDDASWELFRVPGSWNKTTGTKDGLGWIRLKVLLDPGTESKQTEKLGLYITFFYSAYELYVDGRRVANNGIPGKNFRSESPEMRKTVVSLDIPSGKKEIVISARISNFNYVFGGPFNAPVLGFSRDLRLRERKDDTFNAILFGILLMMIGYHLFLWLLRKADKGSLFFALFCIAPILRVIYDSKVLATTFPDLQMFELQWKCAFVPITLLWIFIPTFFSKLFPDEYHIVPLRVFQVLGVIASLFITLTPVRVFSKLIFAYEITLIVLFVWVLYATVMAVKNSRSQAVLIFAGIVVSIVTVINDLLYSVDIVKTGFYSHLGFMGLILCQFATLSIRFNNAYRTADYLSHNLMEEVESKTRDLQQRTREAEEAKREIESVNERLRETDKYKTQFFQNVTHEFRTPLTLIIGHIELALPRKRGHEVKRIIRYYA